MDAPSRRLAGSNLSLPTITATTTLPAAPVTFKAPGVTVTGSYPTAVGKFRFKTVKTLAVILGGGPNCGGAGLSKLKIAAATAKGKF